MKLQRYRRNIKRGFSISSATSADIRARDLSKIAVIIEAYRWNVALTLNARTEIPSVSIMTAESPDENVSVPRFCAHSMPSRTSYSHPINPYVPAAATLWLARMIVTRRVTNFEKRRINLDGRCGAIESVIRARAREIIRQLNDDNQWKVTVNCSRFAAFGKRVITLYVYATPWHFTRVPPITKSLVRTYISTAVIPTFVSWLINVSL